MDKGAETDDGFSGCLGKRHSSIDGLRQPENRFGMTQMPLKPIRT
ncbi:hypothetical protein [Kingella oralis]|nr:hypothetical protein [Kingella oralis]